MSRRIVSRYKTQYGTQRERDEKPDVATQRQRNAIGTQRERDGNATEGIKFDVTFNSLTQRTYRHGVQRKHTMLETHYDASAMKCRPRSEDRNVGIRFSPFLRQEEHC